MRAYLWQALTNTVNRRNASATEASSPPPRGAAASAVHEPPVHPENKNAKSEPGSEVLRQQALPFEPYLAQQQLSDLLHAFQAANIAQDAESADVLEQVHARTCSIMFIAVLRITIRNS